ncbi:PLP-dependent aminotransferase family protein [Dactylosporangium sp. CA-152071]|uniref:aminotransferase-like domain-containing protein n=1 Tax=Dactylosporangium sp. CA-152071 TaxID=3239933 RepID=UPI003D8F2D37
MSVPDLVPLLADWRSHRGPLHQCLALAVTSLIEARLLRPGDRLPSERALARRLGISRTTVAGAYDLLRQRGALHSVRGSGTTVTGDRTLRHDPAIAALAANPFIRSTHPRHSTDSVDLTVCRFDPPTILAETLAHSADALLDLIGSGHDTAGLPELRSALADHLTGHGLPTQPSQLLITTGSQQAPALIASDLERNDRVMIEDPTYFGALHAYLQRRARLLPCSVDHLERAAGLAADEHRVDLVHVTSAVHNPTGRQLDDATGRRVVELAGRWGATVVDDQALRFLADRPPPFLTTHDPHADIITIGTFSKVLWSALRVGWLRAPAPAIARFSARKAALDLATPALDQALVLHCLPHIDALAAHRRQQLTHQRTHLRRRLRQDLPLWHDASGDSGPFLWVRTHLDDADPIVQAAARVQVGITAGRTLTPTDRWNSHIRIAVTTTDTALDAAVDRLADLARTFDDGSPLTAPASSMTTHRLRP